MNDLAVKRDALYAAEDALIAENEVLRSAGTNVPTHYITSLASSGAGTLREILEDQNSTPLRIRSRVGGDVVLAQNINERRSHVILDIPELRVTGAGIHWYGTDSEITNLSLTRGGTALDDALFPRQEAERLWIHHCTLSMAKDELLPIAGKNILVEYCLLYDALPPTGGGLWTTSGAPVQGIVMRRNLEINCFKRAGNANTGLDTKVYENVFVNVSNATFNANGGESDLWHNVYFEGVDHGNGEWNVLKANGGILRLGKNYQINLAGVVSEMNKKVNPDPWNGAERYITLPSPYRDDFDWQALVNDVMAKAGASIRSAADRAVIASALDRTAHLPAPLNQYTG